MNSKGEWEVKVKRVRNGFICEYEEENDEGFYTEEVLFEDKDDKEDGEDLESIKETLIWIKEYFGYYWRKEKENLNIEIKKQNGKDN